jgi:hypothetical protein
MGVHYLITVPKSTPTSLLKGAMCFESASHLSFAETIGKLAIRLYIQQANILFCW